jgi:integrase/recombinase XerD
VVLVIVPSPLAGRGTLKRREHHVHEVSIPPALMAALDRHFKLSEMHHEPVTASGRLWPWHCATAWRHIKQVMRHAGISGHHTTLRGLRHAFGVGALRCNVPLNLVQRWFGHARISTTAIYAEVSGVDEITVAERFWDHTLTLPPKGAAALASALR